MPGWLARLVAGVWGVSDWAGWDSCRSQLLEFKVSARMLEPIGSDPERPLGVGVMAPDVGWRSVSIGLPADPEDRGDALLEAIRALVSKLERDASLV